MRQVDVTDEEIERYTAEANAELDGDADAPDSIEASNATEEDAV